MSAFHACEDPQPRRDLVIGALLNYRTWNFASIVVDKPRVNPTLYDPMMFYPKFAAMMLRFVFRGRVRPGTSQILVYTDTLPFEKKGRWRLKSQSKNLAATTFRVFRFEFFITVERATHGSRLQITAAGACAGNGRMEIRTLIIVSDLGWQLPRLTPCLAGMAQCTTKLKLTHFRRLTSLGQSVIIGSWFCSPIEEDVRGALCSPRRSMSFSDQTVA